MTRGHLWDVQSGAALDVGTVRTRERQLENDCGGRLVVWISGGCAWSLKGRSSDTSMPASVCESVMKMHAAV